MTAAWRGWADARRLRFQIEGDGAPRMLSVSAAGVVWLGRDDDCQVVLSAPQVSRKHLSIFANKGQLFVRDHSAYGTRVNGQALRLSVRRLIAPALLELGPCRVEVAVVGFGPRLVQWVQKKPVRCRLVAAVAAAFVVGVFSAFVVQRASPQPPIAAAECGAGSAALKAALASAALSSDVPTVVEAVQRLRSGDKLQALIAYRALSAQEDSPAPFAVVAGLLQHELSCAP